MITKHLFLVMMLILPVTCLVSCGDSRSSKAKVNVTMTSGGFVKVDEPDKKTGLTATSATSIVSSAAEGSGADMVQQPYVQGLRLPVEYFPDGSIKTQLNADEAKVSQTNGVIFAKGLRFDMFDQKGASEMTVITPDCTFDRVAGKAFSDEKVTMEKQGLTIKGTGYLWDTIGQKMNLYSDVTVVVNRRVVGNSKGLLR